MSDVNETSNEEIKQDVPVQDVQAESTPWLSDEQKAEFKKDAHRFMVGAAGSATAGSQFTLKFGACTMETVQIGFEAGIEILPDSKEETKSLLMSAFTKADDANK
jgi:hypothetical protein